MTDQIIIEIDLIIQPYQGIIGCFQKNWTSWLEPSFIHFFPRDSPISYDIYPGDIILCEKTPVYECDAGTVLMPIKKFAQEELLTYLKNNPKIEIIAWELIAHNMSPLEIARDFFYMQKKIESKKTLNQEEMDRLVSLVNNVVLIPQTTFIFPEMKVKILEGILETINPAFSEKCLEIIGEKQIQIKPYDLLGIILPKLRIAAPDYYLHDEKNLEMDEILKSSDIKEQFKKMKELFLNDFENWIESHSTENINLEWLSDKEYIEIKKKILEIRIAEIEKAPIYVKGVKSLKYDVSSLWNTTIGKKLLKSLKISESKKFIDQSMFNLIEAALRRFNVKINPIKQKK